MRIRIEIGGNPGKKNTVRDLANMVRRTLKEAGHPVGIAKTMSLDVAFVREEEIRKINRQYRKKDEVTDILSFAYTRENKKNQQETYLGELIICLPYIRRTAESDNTDPDSLFCYVFSHGILHLLGWKHGKEMYAIQDKVVGKFSN